MAVRPGGVATAVADGAEILVPLKGIIDIDAERSRLNKERAKMSKLVAGAEKKLGNEKFLGKAPPEVVQKERAKLEEAKDRLTKIDEALERLQEVEKA